jgi:DNA repair protein RecN (Recombination protein N)
MLIELHIQGYAVIDDVAVRLGPGLTVLTGETGAGKSIVVGALSLLLGERASSEVVRAGEDRAVVEAVFEIGDRGEVVDRLQALGFHDEDGLLLLKREVQAQGRNRAWINGSPATASAVWELGSILVDLHGQHEHQTLLRREEQRAVLDALAGARDAAARVRDLHVELRAVEEELEGREERRRELEARADFLRFQVGEIEEAAIETGEEEALDAEASRLGHARELLEGASALHDLLYGGDDAVSDRLAEARNLLGRLAGFDPSMEAVAELVDGAYHQAAEAGRRLGDYGDAVESDPGRLEAIERRKDLLFRLKRKYGPELEDVVATGQTLRAELDELEGAEHDLKELRSRRDAARSELEAAAGALTELRREGAGRLEAAVEELLPGLGMKDGTFRVHLEPMDEPGPGGGESVEFRIALNAGFEPRPLARIASGGELSRVMLALKTILARVDRVPTLVFDEIDAGIGGVVATEVAARLAEVSRLHQVLVITHLPQVAARGDAHLQVAKSGGGGVAATEVRSLTGDARVQEIARMLGGDPESSRSRDHARELLGVAEEGQPSQSPR